MKPFSKNKSIWIMLLTAIEVMAVVILLVVSQAAAGSQLFEFSQAEQNLIEVQPEISVQDWKAELHSVWTEFIPAFSNLDLAAAPGFKDKEPEQMADEPTQAVTSEAQLAADTVTSIQPEPVDDKPLKTWWRQVKTKLSLPEITTFEPIQTVQEWFQHMTTELSISKPDEPAAIPIDPITPEQEQPELLTNADSLNTGMLSYQGFLTNPDGQPLTGLYEMTFRIYNMPDASIPLWEEARWAENAVQVDAGLFNLALGSLVPLPNTLWEQPELYLGITISGEAEMAPRQRLSFVPAAASADIAQLALSVPNGSISAQNLAADVYNNLIQSGKFNCDEITHPDWTLDSGTGERSYTYYITFDKAFTTTPAMLVGIEGFDLGAGTNPRLVARAENISSIGFDLVISTWGDSLVNFVCVSWIAYGE